MSPKSNPQFKFTDIDENKDFLMLTNSGCKITNE